MICPGKLSAPVPYCERNCLLLGSDDLGMKDLALATVTISGHTFVHCYCSTNVYKL